MANRITIEQISLAGFRAYLKEQKFSLRENGMPMSLAVFAPNAKGKSSLVDSLEFFFSDNGSLERLGMRRSGTQAGREALVHFKAVENGIIPAVSIAFRDSSGTFRDRREVLQSDQPPPAAARRILQTRKLDFIIRGHQMRRFVDSQTPQDRYEEVSSWFGLSPLMELQRKLRDLRLRIKRELDDDRVTKERLKDLQQISGGALDTIDTKQALEWINTTQLKPLDLTLVLTELNKENQSYQIIKERKEEEEKNIGVAALKQIIFSIQKVFSRHWSDRDESVKDSGAVPVFENAIRNMEEASSIEKQEREKAEKAVFKDVWEAASTIFSDPDATINVCPVCNTPVHHTSEGSSESIAAHLRNQLDNLRAYRKAEQALQKAKTLVQESRSEVCSTLRNLKANIQPAELAEDMETVNDYLRAVDAWQEEEPPPDASKIKDGLLTLLIRLDDDCRRIESLQGDHTYSKALANINACIDMQNKMKQIEKTKAEMTVLHNSLIAQENFIKEEIRVYVQTLVDTLKTHVNVLYRAVHSDVGEAPSIILSLAEDTKQPQLDLHVDFSSTRQGVVPSGYLSDAQIHTLALSLRLAAIRLFNTEVPIIVLDDVVTSYDTDHRKKIAAMLAEKFAEFQVILVTHDEQFFGLLQDHLPEATWRFKRITRLDPDFGPQFSNYMIPDDLIDEKLKRGESAANDIRQSQEEWLLKICRDFGVDIRIRAIDQPYNYGRAELATALHCFLKKIKVVVPKIPGMSNHFLLSLQKGAIENLGSHFQDNPNTSSSIGDEQARWQDFKEFRSMFTCIKGHKGFKRPIGMNRPVCKTCEAPFELVKH